MIVAFFVPGLAKPQGSKRALVNKHTGKPVVIESAGDAHKDWRAMVTQTAHDHMDGAPAIDEGPISVSLVFRLPRPKSHPKTRVTWPCSRPDIDKLTRSVLDSLTCVCFRDDSQVVHLVAEKRWAERDEQIGLDVVLHRVRATA